MNDKVEIQQPGLAQLTKNRPAVSGDLFMLSGRFLQYARRSVSQPCSMKRSLSAMWVLFENMRVSVSPAPMPEVRVAVSGVLVRGLIPAMNLKSSPSSAMAQITRGIGNIAPSRLPLGGGGRPAYIVSTLTPTRMQWNMNKDTSSHIQTQHNTVNDMGCINNSDMQEHS